MISAAPTLRMRKWLPLRHSTRVPARPSRSQSYQQRYSATTVPLYMDRHDLPDATAADLAAAHVRDLEVQGRFGVRFVTYWFEEEARSGFCLIEGPDAESVEAAHRAAHGMLPSHVIEVDQASVRGFFGRLNTHPPGEPHSALRGSGARAARSHQRPAGSREIGLLLRGSRLRQDCRRRMHLAAGQRRAARADSLDPATRRVVP